MGTSQYNKVHHRRRRYRVRAATKTMPNTKQKYKDRRLPKNILLNNRLNLRDIFNLFFVIHIRFSEKHTIE